MNNPCKNPFCPNTSVEGSSFCLTHKRAIAASYQRDRVKRGNVDPFYRSKEWRNIRQRKLFLNPFCEECSRHSIATPATDIDHIVAITAGGARLDIQNLRALCHSCHSRKTAKENASKMFRRRESPGERLMC